jgi:hypothetical protein
VPAHELERRNGSDGGAFVRRRRSLFGVWITLSIASGWVIIETQKLASNDLHSGFTLKKNFKIINF